jgi:dephospho-CoA kinase
MKNKMILAIVGLPGSGKTESLEYLKEKLGWPKIYFGDVTFDRMKERRIEITEANERVIREGFRKERGMGAYAILNIPKIEKLFKDGSLFIESLYSWEEYLEVKKNFGDYFKVLAIYSSPETRIARLKGRPVRPLTEDELISRDYSQIENLHQAGPIARADWAVVNEGSKEDLEKELDKVIFQIKEKLNL